MPRQRLFLPLGRDLCFSIVSPSAALRAIDCGCQLFSVAPRGGFAAPHPALPFPLPSLQAHTFGLHLCKLDIRQESVKHTEAIDAITTHLGLGSYK